MTEQFQKFKRKLLWIRLLKSGMAGLAGGALTGGVLHFLSRFGFLPMPPVLSWPIAAAVFLGIGILIFFLLRASDAGVARRLDSEFGLAERVQTAVAYRDEQSTLHQMQREDAEASLEAVAKKHLKFGRLWVYIVALVLSAAVLATSLILRPLPPPDEEGGEEVVIPYTLSATEEQALLALIEEVRASGMDSPYKENVVTSIEGLLASLRLATNMTERDAALSASLAEIHEETDESSQALEIIEALWYSGDERVRLLAEAINYYTWKDGDALDERMDKFRQQLKLLAATDPDADKAQLLQDGVLLLNGVAESITLSLLRLSVDGLDPLAVSLDMLANANTDPLTYGLKGCAEKGVELNDYQRMQDEWVTPKMSVHKMAIAAALERDLTNTGTGEAAMTRIGELFGYTVPPFDRPQLVTDSAPEDGGSGGEGGGGGGAIGGGTIYGSDDLVLDPKTDTFVEYGKILNDYYALMFGKGENGAFTEEEQAMLEKYFQILYGTDYQQ